MQESYKSVPIVYIERSNEWKAESEVLEISLVAGSLKEAKQKIDKLLSNRSKGKAMEGWTCSWYGASIWRRARTRGSDGGKIWVTYLDKAGSVEREKVGKNNFVPDTPDNAKSIRLILELNEKIKAIKEERLYTESTLVRLDMMGAVE